MRWVRGLSTYRQWERKEAAGRAGAGGSDVRSRDVLARWGGVTLSREQRLSEELGRRGREPHLVMLPYTPVIDRYIERIDTPDWHQHVLSIYLVGGLFDGFFAELAQGIDDGFKGEAIEILLEHTGRDDLHELLASELAVDPQLPNRLALWGRRLVGDTLLVSREVLSLSEGRTFVASHVEPIFTELIADHSRRMDDLGLTA